MSSATEGQLILPCAELQPGAEYVFRAVAEYPADLQRPQQRETSCVASEATASITTPATVPDQVEPTPATNSGPAS